MSEFIFKRLEDAVLEDLEGLEERYQLLVLWTDDIAAASDIPEFLQGQQRVALWYGVYDTMAKFKQWFLKRVVDTEAGEWLAPADLNRGTACE